VIDLSKADSPPGVMPLRAEPREERVLHLHLGTSLEPQTSLCAALASLVDPDDPVGYRRINWVGHDTARVRARLVEQARVGQPTLLWMQLQTGGVVDPQTLMAVREVAPGVRIVSWCGDIGRDPSWSHELAPYCDAMFFSSMTQAHQHREAGFPNAAYLQIGYDTETHHGRRAAGAPPRHKVVFQGQNYNTPWVHCPEAEPEARRELVHRLNREFGPDAFAVYGQNWGGIESGVLQPAVSALRYRDAIAAVSISLTSRYARYSSDRLFRALACEPVVLVKRFDDMAALGLKGAENCLVFDTPEECAHLARVVLYDGDSWVREIATAGGKLAREHHTWPVRMEEMAAYLEVLDA